MFPRRSHLLQSFTTITPNKVKFKYNDVEQKAFDVIKRDVAHDNLKVYPYFNKRFHIHTDASNCHIGAVIL